MSRNFYFEIKKKSLSQSTHQFDPCAECQQHRRTNIKNAAVCDKRVRHLRVFCIYLTLLIIPDEKLSKFDTWSTEHFQARFLDTSFRFDLFYFLDKIRFEKARFFFSSSRIKRVRQADDTGVSKETPALTGLRMVLTLQGSFTGQEWFPRKNQRPGQCLCHLSTKSPTIRPTTEPFTFQLL